MNDKQVLYTAPTKVYISDKNKAGEPLVDKNGKAYKKVAIKLNEFPDVWLSCLCYPPKANYSPRRELEMIDGEKYWLVVEQNGDFFNFKLASSIDELRYKVESLEKKVDFLYKEIKKKENVIGEDVLEEVSLDEF